MMRNRLQDSLMNLILLLVIFMIVAGLVTFTRAEAQLPGLRFDLFDNPYPEHWAARSVHNADCLLRNRTLAEEKRAPDSRVFAPEFDDRFRFLALCQAVRRDPLWANFAGSEEEFIAQGHRWIKLWTVSYNDLRADFQNTPGVLADWMILNPPAPGEPGLLIEIYDLRGHLLDVYLASKPADAAADWQVMNTHTARPVLRHPTLDQNDPEQRSAIAPFEVGIDVGFRITSR